MSGVRICQCGSTEIFAIRAGSDPVYAELRPWSGMAELTARVPRRDMIRIRLTAGTQDRSWCRACWPCTERIAA